MCVCVCTHALYLQHPQVVESHGWLLVVARVTTKQVMYL